MDTLPAPLRRFTDWFDNRALPLWAKAGWDEGKGGFYEALDFSGRPLANLPRRVRVQTRQIHVFAGAAAAGLHPDAERLAKEGFDYFLAKACPDDGKRGCVHVLAPDGAVVDERRDLYDQAFLLLACASMWSAFRDERAIKRAERTMRFLDGELASTDGGWLEDDRGTLPRRQNPHMHLFEAYMAMFDATGDERWLGLADKVYALFRDRFFRLSEGRVVEYFSAGLTPEAGLQGDYCEPGHMMEWIGLLDRYAGRRNADVAGIAERLFEQAGAAGAMTPHGFLPQSVQFGRPGGAVSGRLWPQTEYLKACLVFAGRGDAKAAVRGAALIEAIFATYLNTAVPGLWNEQFGHDGAQLSKDVQASILYHLYDAANEARRYLAEKKA